MSTMDDSDEYAFEVIENEEVALACAKLIAEEFAKHEDPCKFHGTKAQDFFDKVAWPSMKECMAGHLSVYVRHRPSNEIVAAITAHDLYMTQMSHSLNEVDSPKAIPMIDILTEMEIRFVSQKFGQELKPGLVLHIWTGATRESYSGKGLAKRLRAFLIANAEKKGFQYAYVQTTSSATNHIYVSKFGGKVLEEVDPATWVWKKKGDGTTCPYKGYTGCKVSSIMMKIK